VDHPASRRMRRTSREKSATLCDHQFGLLNGAQFLPIDDDRNVARSMTEPRFENIRHNRFETFDQVISRRSVVIRPSVLVATHTPASASWNASKDRVRRPSVMVEIPRQVQSVCSFVARSLDRFADMPAILPQHAQMVYSLALPREGAKPNNVNELRKGLGKKRPTELQGVSVGLPKLALFPALLGLHALHPRSVREWFHPAEAWLRRAAAFDDGARFRPTRRAAERDRHCRSCNRHALRASACSGAPGRPRRVARRRRTGRSPCGRRLCPRYP
jgi:hypothetical protein